MTNITEGLAENIISELRRGVISMAVLSLLEQEQYGYLLLRRLMEQGLEVDQGTLYPLLRRLESQGLLRSSWRVESDRPRRYYVISEQGSLVLRQLKKEWENLVIVLDGIMK